MHSYELDAGVDLLLREYIREKLYGTIEIKFENGKVVLMTRKETIKPAANERNNRESEHER